MKNIFLIFVGLLLIPVIIPSYGEFILWEESKHLKWSDFQGIPDIFPESYEGKKDNIIAFTWGYFERDAEEFHKIPSFICQYQISHVDGKNNFSTDESWYKPDEIGALTLEHEQGHFDIIEIHTRMYEKELQYKIFPCPSEIYDESEIQNQINSIYDKHYQQSLEHHKRYDESVRDKEGFFIESKQPNRTLEIQTDLQKYQSDRILLVTDNKTIPEITIEVNDENFKCIVNWDIVQKKSNAKLYCLTPLVAEKLESRGWGTIVSPEN